MHAAVWTWEVPLYFWFGGIAAGSSFVAAGLRPGGRPRARPRSPRRSRWRPRALAAAADHGPRPPRALPQHAAHLQAALADVDGRVVPVGVLDRGGRRGGRRPDRPRARGARGGRGHRVPRHLPGLLHRRAPGLHRGAGLGAQPGCSCRPIFVCTAAATGAAATRLALAATGTRGRPPHAQRARHGRDRRHGHGAGALDLQREAPGPPGRRAGGGAAGHAVHAGQVGRARRPGAALRPQARRPVDAPRWPACSTSPPGWRSASPGWAPGAPRPRTTRRWPGPRAGARTPSRRTRRSRRLRRTRAAGPSRPDGDPRSARSRRPGDLRPGEPRSAGRPRSSRRTAASGATRARRRPSSTLWLDPLAVAPRAAATGGSSPCRSSATPSMAGTAPALTSISTPLAWAISQVWPSRP